MSYYDSIMSTISGTIIGCYLSHPFDVMKTKYTCNPNVPFEWSWRGLVPRLATTTIGLGMGGVIVEGLKSKM